MITVTYNSEGIKVNVEYISKYNQNLPLKLKIKKHVSGELQWSTNLNDNWFATYPSTEMFDVEICDSKDKIIYVKKWDVMEHGNHFYKSLWMYNKSVLSNGKFPKGLVIGTHDGEFGEWVLPTLGNLTKTTLVEASTPQFTKLTENYKNFPNVDLIQNLVTTDGSKVKFFEGGQGYTNSVKENVIRNWEKEEINSNLRDSVSINNLINQISPDKKLDWLHLDIEGYDDEILRAINVDLLPNFIIFEHNNLLMEDKLRLENYLIDLGYYLNRDDSVSYLAIK